MKFGIDIGHNCPPDTGCQGVQLEDKLTRDVGLRVMAKLIADGHEVINCLPTGVSDISSSLDNRCDIANEANCDVFVSIHFDCYDKKVSGSATFYLSDEGRKIAELVLDEIVKLGFKNRGAKERGLYILKYTEMPAILVECCFCDNQDDMRLYDPEAMSDAIVEGLTKYSATKPQTQ